MQRNFDFSASFNVLSLAGSNNLLTHTHLASNYTFFTFAYARAKCVASPINKGLQGVPFVRFFVSVFQVRKGKNQTKYLSLKQR